MYLLRNTASWIAFLVPPSLIFALFSSCFCVMSVSITSLALLIPTLIFSLKKPKPISKNQQQEEAVSNSSSEIKKIAAEFDGMGEGQIGNLYSEESESDYGDEQSSSVDEDCSDGSISDEESLIEISLIPRPHFLGNQNDKEKEIDSKQQNCCVMEFLNEEDNMIEIDLSMGSIKCSGFQIQASS